MTYATEGLKLLIPGIDSQPNVWTYVSADIHTTVASTPTGYFTDGAARGMKVGDVVFVGRSDTAIGYTIHYVATVTALDASPYTLVEGAILSL